MKTLFSSSLARLLLVLLLTAVAVMACILIGRLSFVRLSFAWILIILSCSAAAVCALIPKTWVTYVSLAFMSFFITCAGVEFYYYFTSDDDNTVMEGGYASAPNPVLGYGPKPQAAVMPSKRTFKGTCLYDIVYTSKADGWRVTPEHPDAPNAALFFGCSYTMGEGVKDAESYPYRVGELLGSDWQVYNFGFSGYGPHQFLAFLESGQLDNLRAMHKNIHIFWMNIPGHELRSGGYSSWDAAGPRYVLENGVAVRRGFFNTTEGGFFMETLTYTQNALLRTQLCKEFLVQVLRWNAEPLLQLQTAILVSARDHIQKHWPGAHFTLLVYPSAAGNVPRFRQAGLPVLDLSPFLPGDPYDKQYRIPVDRHPTPLAYDFIARELAHRLRSDPAQ